MTTNKEKLKREIGEMLPILTKVMELFDHEDVSMTDGGRVFLFLAATAFSEAHRKNTGGGTAPTHKQIGEIFVTFSEMMVFCYGTAILDGGTQGESQDDSSSNGR